MDRFLSNAVNRIDAKGRVSVPAHFRSVLQKRGFSELYALRSLTLPAMDISGPDRLDQIEAGLPPDDPIAPLGGDLRLYVYGDGTLVKIDPEGRMMVSDFIREHTGISSEVTFVGQGNFFQLWEPAKFETHRLAVRARLAAQKEAAARRAAREFPE